MASEDEEKAGLRIKSRVTLFLVLPFSVGSFGFLLSYGKMKTLEGHEVNFDTDFIIPFLMTFVVVSVIMIQTQGFKREAKPLVSWPKLVKKKKIVRKTVIVDDDGNVIEDENILKKLEKKMNESKKSD